MVTLRMIFKDTGIGMSRDYIPRLFEPFSQEAGSAKNKYGSTGLGMAIVTAAIDPDILIIGGGVAGEGEPLLKRIKGNSFGI